MAHGCIRCRLPTWSRLMAGFFSFEGWLRATAANKLREDLIGAGSYHIWRETCSIWSEDCFSLSFDVAAVSLLWVSSADEGGRMKLRVFVFRYITYHVIYYLHWKAYRYKYHVIWIRDFGIRSPAWTTSWEIDKAILIRSPFIEGVQEIKNIRVNSKIQSSN